MMSPVNPIEEKKRMKKVLVAVLLLVVMLSLSGCNTLRGIGQDIERGGQAIKKAAD
jgi:predicted small secreted protein